MNQTPDGAPDEAPDEAPDGAPASFNKLQKMSLFMPKAYKQSKTVRNSS